MFRGVRNVSRRLLAGGGAAAIMAGTSGVALGDGEHSWSSAKTAPVLPAQIPGLGNNMHVLRRTPYTVDKQKGGDDEAAETSVNITDIPMNADSMADELSHRFPGIPVGKILIQRDEETALPKLFFSKLPKDVKTRLVFLVDPMLATGGSASAAIRVLQEAGVKDEHIIMLSIVAAPEGLQALMARHPKVRVLVGEVDDKLNSKAYIVPGLGDFGDRFFGTA